MKNLKTLAVFLILSLLFVACDSSPDPAPLPESTETAVADAVPEPIVTETVAQEETDTNGNTLIDVMTTATIHGDVFEDWNQDDSWQKGSGEEAIEGLTVTLSSQNGAIGHDETITDNTGYYIFENIEPGTYIVEIFYDEEWVPVSGHKTTEVVAGDIVRADFGMTLRQPELPDLSRSEVSTIVVEPREGMCNGEFDPTGWNNFDQKHRFDVSNGFVSIELNGILNYDLVNHHGQLISFNGSMTGEAILTIELFNVQSVQFFSVARCHEDFYWIFLEFPFEDQPEGPRAFNSFGTKPS